MLDVKKKFSNLLPSSARAQLQNVLTVEWDTHKTVLVQVPGGGSEDVDMEMGGMDKNGKRDNYGRLADEDETEALFNQSSFNASRSQWNANHSSSSSSRDTAKLTKKRGAPPPLAPRPYDYQAENPFDENSPSYQASIGRGSGMDYDISEYGRGLPGTPEKKPAATWSSFGETQTPVRMGGAKQGNGAAGGMNPWGRGGEWSLTPSPTSSAGTRESVLYEAENPFR